MSAGHDVSAGSPGGLAAHRSFLLELLGIPRTSSAELQQRANTVDWHVVLDQAGLALHPMLAFRIDERGVAAPAWVLERVRWARRANAMAIARRRAEMNRVFAALAQQNVPVTVLKGYALAHLVYASPELRVMNDIDLWLNVPSLRPAMRTLEPLGWQSPWWRQTHERIVGDGESVGLRFRKSSLLMELHRRPASLADRVQEVLPDMWQRRVPVRLGDANCHVLTAEDTLLHLSLHISDHHQFLRALSGLLDLTLVVEHAGNTIDWQRFAARCVALGAAGWVATTLGTAVRMLGARVPSEALAAFGVPELDQLCARASDQNWWCDGTGLGPSSVLVGHTRGEQFHRFAIRIKDLALGGHPSTSFTADGWLRLFRRLAAFVRYTLPRQVVALVHVRGTVGAQMRRLAFENQELLADMVRAGELARSQQGVHAPGDR